MNAQNQIGVYLPLSEIFSDVQNDIDTFRSLLINLSRTDTLFWCARLNLVVSANANNIDGIEAQQFGLNQFYKSNEIEAINEFAQNHGGVNRIKVFFRGQLLELFRWVALLCGYERDAHEIMRFYSVNFVLHNSHAKRVTNRRARRTAPYHLPRH